LLNASVSACDRLHRRDLVGEHAAVPQPDHPVGLRGEVEVVGDDDERSPVLPVHPPHDRDQLGAGLGPRPVETI
jgi:hypothetical protein